MVDLPDLSLERWEPTKDTLRVWTQIVGKVKLASHLAFLAYNEVRNAPDPRGTLLEFLQSAYEAGAFMAGWEANDFRSHWSPSESRSSSTSCVAPK